MPGSPLDVRIIPDTLRTIAASTFTGSYQKLGTSLSYPCRILKFTNNTNQNVTVSWDGINAHEFLPAGSFILIDVSSNREVANQFAAPADTQFYVSASVGTGTFYLSVYYAH